MAHHRLLALINWAGTAAVVAAAAAHSSSSIFAVSAVLAVLHVQLSLSFSVALGQTLRLLCAPGHLRQLTVVRGVLELRVGWRGKYMLDVRMIVSDGCLALCVYYQYVLGPWCLLLLRITGVLYSRGGLLVYAVLAVASPSCCVCRPVRAAAVALHMQCMLSRMC